jgi:hypothetical protein
MTKHEPVNRPAADHIARPNRVRGERSMNPSSQVPRSKSRESSKVKGSLHGSGQ